MANTAIATNPHTFMHGFRAGMAGPFCYGDKQVVFYIDTNSDLAYVYSSDAGATWGSPVIAKAGTISPLAFQYATERQGDTSDDLYIAYYNAATNDIIFRKFHVDTETLDGEVDIGNGAGIGGSLNTIFISGAQNGDIGVGWVSSTFSISVFVVSTNGGSSFSASTSPWEAHAADIVMGIWPETSTASDHAILFYDLSAGEISVKVLNSGSWTETSIVSGLATSISGSAQAIPFDAPLLPSGTNLLFLHTDQDAAGNDLKVYSILVDTPAGPDITALTDVVTNSAVGGVTATIDPSDHSKWYVAYVDPYLSVSGVIKYKISADAGSTWGAATDYSEGTVDFRYIGQNRAHFNQGGRWQPASNENTGSIYVNLVNDAALPATINASVVLTGTLVPTAVEDSVAAGGLTLIATVTGVNWHADIDNDDTESEDFLAGLVSAGAEALGWNGVVIGKFYRREVLNDSPLNYLRLGGNVTDLGSVGQNGTATALTVGSALLLSSVQASSVFNAATAKVALSSPAGLDNLWDGGGTAEIIARPWASGFTLDQSKLFSKIDGGAGWELILDNQSGGYVDLSLRVDFSTSQGVWKVPGRVPIGYQTHIAVTFNADSVSNDPTFYINGIPYTPNEETTPVGTRSTDASSNLWIGSNSSAAVTFNGELQESALYGSELSATRIQAHVLAASNRYGVRYSDLVRTSATVVTLTLPAFPFYDISVAETITATFPVDVFASAPDTVVVATPTFQITPSARTTNFTPPANPFTPASQTPGPFGNVNGGLGPAAGDAFRVLGAGDEWQIGIPQLSVGLAGTTQPRVLMIRATEITEITDD